MRQKIVIGLIGKPSAGKETVAKEITQIFEGNVSHITFSGALHAFLLDMGYEQEEIGRPLLQRLAINLIKHFGNDAVARGVLCSAQKTDMSVLICDGVRREADLAALKRFEKDGAFKCLMIYIHADPHARYDRQKRRKQRAGEAELAWEEFLKQDNAPTEQEIEELGKKEGVFRIDNNGSLEALREQIDVFVRKFLLPTCVMTE